MILQTSDIKDIGKLIETDKLEMTYNTPGWYVLYVLFMVMVIFVLYRLISNWKNNKYRRDAIIRIKKANTIYEVNVTLKIVALKSYGRTDVANLSSEAWVEFLNSKSKVEFDKDIFNFVYNGKVIEEVKFQSLKDDTVKWIKYHAKPIRNIKVTQSS